MQPSNHNYNETLVNNHPKYNKLYHLCKDLDCQINETKAHSSYSESELQFLKRQKLRIRDMMRLIEQRSIH